MLQPCVAHETTVLDIIEDKHNTTPAKNPCVPNEVTIWGSFSCSSVLRTPPPPRLFSNDGDKASVPVCLFVTPFVNGFALVTHQRPQLSVHNTRRIPRVPPHPSCTAASCVNNGPDDDNGLGTNWLMEGISESLPHETMIMLPHH